MPLSKTCTKCYKTKSPKEFHKNIAGAMGLRAECKLCTAKYNQNYFVLNKEKVLAGNKAWATRNKEQHTKQRHEYYIAHKEERRKYNYTYYRRHAQRLKAYAKKYVKIQREKFPERTLKKMKARNRLYRKKYPERIAATKAKRYALTHGASYAELFPREEIYARDNGICHICNLLVTIENYQIDHIIPVSKGGPHIRENVATSHSRCNQQKGNKLLSDLFQEIIT